MKCPQCGLELIHAIDTYGASLVLVDNPKLYGHIWGHNQEVRRNGQVYEFVRPLLGVRQLHSDVCKGN